MTDITPQLSLWIQQLRDCANRTRVQSTNLRSRTVQLLELAATMTATMNGSATLDQEFADALAKRWRTDIVPGVPGYVTPKVGAGVIVFNDRDEILLIKRTEGVWFFPTGWCDVGMSPAATVVTEMREEVGLDVTPLRVIGIYDSMKWQPDWLHLYSIVFYCRLDGGDMHLHPAEVLDAGFFAREALPSPMMIAKTNWVEHAWQAHRGERTETFFDQ